MVMRKLLVCRVPTVYTAARKSPKSSEVPIHSKKSAGAMTVVYWVSNNPLKIFSILFILSAFHDLTIHRAVF